MDGEMAVIYCPPEVGSEGSRIGLGLLMVVEGVETEIGVELVKLLTEDEVTDAEIVDCCCPDVVCGLYSVFSWFNTGFVGVLSDSKSDSQSETFSLHTRSISSQITCKTKNYKIK